MLESVADYEDGTNKTVYDEQNTGLLVCNATSAICDGLNWELYVWSGTEWRIIL